jgi:hypothetical protein
MIGDVHSNPLPTSRDNPTLGDGLETAIGTGSGANIHKTSSLRHSTSRDSFSVRRFGRHRVIHHVCHVRARLPAWQLMTHLSLVFLTTAGAGERSQCSARLPWLEIGAMPQRLMAATRGSGSSASDRFWLWWL